MFEFVLSRRTTITEEDLLAAFVGAVEVPTHPPQERNGLEGKAEWGVMRWRERTYDPDTEGGGVSFGPKCEARVTKKDGVLTIQATVTTTVGYWFAPVFALVAFVTMFAVPMFIDPENWKGPWWLAWLLLIGGMLFVAQAFRQICRTGRDVRAFLEGLIDDAEAVDRGASRS